MAAYTTIDNPELYFQTKIYTGDGNDDRDIVFDVTDTTMQPNMLMSARRDSGDNHSIYDSVRGVTKRIHSDLANAEDTNTAGLTAFGSDGFTVATGHAVNKSTATFVAWC